MNILWVDKLHAVFTVKYRIRCFDTGEGKVVLVQVMKAWM